MDIKDGGDTILAYFSETKIPDKKIDINSNKVNYNKKSENIIFSDKVTLKDNENLISIESNKIKYEKKKDLVYSHGNTIITKLIQKIFISIEINKLFMEIKKL